MNSLAASKTPGIIISEIIMMNSTFKGVHFLVEGDDDSRFWKPRISSSGTSIVNCEGKSNLIGACSLACKLGLPNVVGIYDPDFERLSGIVHFPNILSPTDENDLELTIIAGAALESVLHEYADPALVATFENVEGLRVVEYIERMSREFGKLRYISSLLNHRVDFERLSPFRFIRSEDWALDLTGLHSEYARLAGISTSDLSAHLVANIPVVSSWQLSQGHDTVKILAQGLRKRLGRKQISDQDLMKVLRIGYSIESLKRSSMYQTLKGIETSQGCRIFD